MISEDEIISLASLIGRMHDTLARLEQQNADLRRELATVKAEHAEKGAV